MNTLVFTLLALLWYLRKGHHCSTASLLFSLGEYIWIRNVQTSGRLTSIWPIIENAQSGTSWSSNIIVRVFNYEEFYGLLKSLILGFKRIYSNVYVIFNIFNILIKLKFYLFVRLVLTVCVKVMRVHNLKYKYLVLTFILVHSFYLATLCVIGTINPRNIYSGVQ